MPTRTPPATLEVLRASCVSGGIQKFPIKRDNVQFIKELLDRGLHMDTLYTLEAVNAQAKDILEVFLKNGWNINQPISELKPPLLGYAIQDKEMVAWLLDHGADPNRQCVIDLTPLSLAIESAPVSVIQLMLNRGGDIRKGQLLHHAIERHSDNITVLSLLLGKGADINSTMYEDHYPSRALFSFMGLGTPLHKAAELGKADVARYLVSKGANLHNKDGKGRTALDYAHMLNQRVVIHALEEGK
ncbi:hypothetical protein POX_f08020 [Penicillium oxalicum]|uniref:hypothetical protein n=1 Tax=Penicillium oxalicum TaxID=69781 RepID=UPI0020B6E24C|nr:hypothetical protein POX_f08020 [Penicillium oxalicum]KAI2787646.1 hypothetical protein POX_f08020 [Penicillium oxalicum]